MRLLNNPFYLSDYEDSAMSTPVIGSYRADDVTILLKQIEMPPLEIVEKERMIQSGQRHYSEMISQETPPSSAYIRLFHDACKTNNPRFCTDLIRLARQLAELHQVEITLVSLARAGTPVGVLLKRILEQYFCVKVAHYSISIIRDKGIDENALRHILNRDKRNPAGIVFIDGWTGKGVISTELKRSVEQFNRTDGTKLSSDLYVVADISGTASFAATSDDYLIPSAIMNSIVSGLISRSILNSEYISGDDFHGCIYYREFESIDLSRHFVDNVMSLTPQLWKNVIAEPDSTNTTIERDELRRKSLYFLERSLDRFGLTNINHIKPGIGESTRVLLRRVPYLLILRDETLPEVAHLLLLAKEKGVPVEIDKTLPYNATAIIAKVD